MGKTRRERQEEEAKRIAKRRGGMAYESAIIDPKTGESYSGGPDTPEAREQRLRIAEAYRRLDAGDNEGFRKLMMGEDLDTG